MAKNMKYAKLLTLSIIPFALCSCLAVGVPYTSDPYSLVGWSYEMMRRNRPIRAKEFAEEAITKFEKSGDKKGLAEACMAYALYHKRIFTIATEPSLYSTDTYPPRRPYGENIDYDKSEQYYLKAINYFEQANSFEGLSRAYAILATVYDLKKQKEKELDALNKSEEFYRKMKEQDPKAETKLVLQKNQTFLDFLKQSREDAAKL